MISESSNYRNEGRNYGIDLLRIFAMIGIVGLHVLGHGGVLQNVQSGIRYIIAWGLEVLFSCCVNIYALISGYIGISRKKYSISKLLQLWFEVLFYGIVIWWVMSTATNYETNGTSLLHAFMPVSSKEYWYFTAYVGVFLLMPLLNCILHHINQNAALKMIIGFFALSGYATVVRVFGDPLTLKDGCTFVWLTILYLIGGLIKKYQQYLCTDRRRLLIIIGLSFFFVLLWKVVFGMFGITILGNSVGGLFITSLSPPMLLMAICYVCIFRDIKISPFLSKIIGFAAPCTFGVYLVHDNPLVREYFISDSLISVCQKSSLVFVCIILFVIIFVFVCGILIDKLRAFLFKIVRIDALSDKFALFFEGIFSKIISKIIESKHK